MIGGGRAIVGTTGFVGGNLRRQWSFDDFYSSRDSSTMSGRHYSLVAFAAARAEKWRANADPDADSAHISRLEDLLRSFTTDRLLLISTIDVYPRPFGVTEQDDVTDADVGQPYGRHRRRLEQTAVALHPTTIVRLPGLFGDGLKKNVIFDLLYGNQVDRLSRSASIQYYGLDHLGRDLDVALEAGLDLVNFATPPLRTSNVADLLGVTLPAADGQPGPVYDVRTIHSRLWGRSDGYLQDQDQVKKQILAFADRARRLS